MTEPPKPQPRPGGRSARIHEAVLKAALDLLETGHPTSLPDIAERAGVAPSSVYRRWGSWENVLAEALLASSQAEIGVSDTGSFRQDLIDFATGVARYLESPRGHSLAKASISLGDSDEFDAARDRFWRERFALAAVIVERGCSRGEISPTVDAQLLLEALIAPLHFRRLVTHHDLTHDLAERVDLLLAGAEGSRG